jgi:DNA-binding response OmpR family regulator
MPIIYMRMPTSVGSECFVSTSGNNFDSRRGRVPPTLLIVDDETDVADTCARVLRKAGFDCLVTYDSPAALALFDSRQPALVLSDISLPTHDGFEIARYVRQKSAETPVILMTANHRADMAKKAAQMGASHYLRKPFSNSELIGAVKSLLPDGHTQF